MKNLKDFENFENIIFFLQRFDFFTAKLQKSISTNDAHQFPALTRRPSHQLRQSLHNSAV